MRPPPSRLFDRAVYHGIIGPPPSPWLTSLAPPPSELGSPFSTPQGALSNSGLDVPMPFVDPEDMRSWHPWTSHAPMSHCHPTSMSVPAKPQPYGKQRLHGRHLAQITPTAKYASKGTLRTAVVSSRSKSKRTPSATRLSNDIECARRTPSFATPSSTPLHSRHLECVPSFSTGVRSKLYTARQ